MQHSDSDETYCSEIERSCITLRRSSRLNKGQRKESKYFQYSLTNVNKKRKYTKKKPLSCIVKKSNKKIVNEQSIKAIKAFKNKNADTESTSHLEELKNMEKIRKNLISWTELVCKHVSGRKHIDYKTATKILSELKIIKNVCTTDSNYMQVWEKLMKQYNCITCEHEATTVYKQDTCSRIDPATSCLDGSKFIQEKNNINSHVNDIIFTPQTTNKVTFCEESQSILVENKANNNYNKFSQEGLRIVIKNATLVNKLNNPQGTRLLTSTINSENKSSRASESETQCEVGQNVKNYEISHHMEILKITDDFPKFTFSEPLFSGPKTNSKEENYSLNYSSPDIIFDSQNIPAINNFTTIVHKSREQNYENLFDEKHIEKNNSLPAPSAKQSDFGNYVNECKPKKNRKQNEIASTQKINMLVKESGNILESIKIQNSKEISSENNQSTGTLNVGSCSSKKISSQNLYVGKEAQNSKYVTKILASSKKPIKNAPQIAFTDFSTNMLSSVSAETNNPIENAAPIAFTNCNTNILGSVSDETKKPIENAALIASTEHSTNILRLVSVETQKNKSSQIFFVNKGANLINGPASSNKLNPPISDQHSFTWMKHIEQVRKMNPREYCPLNMLPHSFLDIPIAKLPLDVMGNFEIW